MVPLTSEDFLNPQEGDVMPQAPFHDMATRDLENMLQAHFRYQPNITIFRDLIMNWGISGLKNPSPDISVVPNVRNPEAILHEGQFHVLAEETRPVLVIEVVSPHYRAEDREDKVEIYEQAGVLEYVILDRVRRRRQMVNEVLGYRLVRGIYRPITPNEDGLIECQTVGLRFGLEGARVVIEEIANGRRLRTHDEEVTAREQAEARAETAEARLAELEAELRLLRSK
jgi:Uma2 family endonuclease